MNKTKGFYCLWLGLTLSVFGSELTEFALGLWLLKEHTSVSAYTNMHLALHLPAFFLLPFIGYIIDSNDKRKVLLITELLSAIATIGIFIIYYLGLINTVIVYVYIGITSVFTAFQIDCYSTLVYRLVPKEKLAKANSLNGLGDSLPVMLGPFIGAFLFTHYGLGAVLSFDSLTFILSVLVTSLLFRVSTVNFLDTEDGKKPKFTWRSTLPDVGSVKIIKQSITMTNLMQYTLFRMLLVGTVFVSVVPYFNDIYGPKEAGYMLSIGGAAMVAISLLSSWKHELFKTIPVTVTDAIFGGSIILLTMFENIYAQAACIVLCFACFRLSNIRMRTVWQCSVPQNFHGRIFAFKNIIETLSYSVSIYLTGWSLDFFQVEGNQFPVWSLTGNDTFYIIASLLLTPLLVYFGHCLFKNLDEGIFEENRKSVSI